MTIFQFALVREAATRMTPWELEKARALAKRAEAGDRKAEWELRTLVESALWDESRVSRDEG